MAFPSLNSYGNREMATNFSGYKEYSVNCFVHAGEGTPHMDYAVNQLAFGGLSSYTPPGSKMLMLKS